MKISLFQLFLLFTSLAFPGNLMAQEGQPVFSQQEVIYGRKDGMALTMVVLTPKTKPNGRGIISLTTQGWYSTYQEVPEFTTRAQPLLKKGFTIFIILHSTVPKYSKPEMVADIRQAIRFIRYNAKTYAIAPDKLGITGRSAGGQLALLIATAEEPMPEDTTDPLGRTSSRVQAVACFFPPTDLLNWSKPGEALVLNKSRLAKGKVRPNLKYSFRPAFEFTEWNEQAGMLVPVIDVNQQLEISKQLSPLYLVTPDDPPAMIAHGDGDQGVPIQHSQNIMERLKENKIPHQLIVRKGAGHGWPDEEVEVEQFAIWFDKYLK